VCTSIRAGSAEDVDSCVLLWTRVISARDGTEFVNEVAERAREAFARTIVRLAIAGIGPDGFALTLVRRPGVALLSRICVHPLATSRGLGAALLEDAVKHSRDAGFGRVELDVRETNERAIALYARAGFVAASDPWSYDAGDRVVTWSLDL
jgi:ribosomal protein S18 acetylase RimI-like enzyme